jgi:uncharacterized cupin superfamily protein
MIVRKSEMRIGRAEEGGREWLYASDMGGITQFGAYVETLQPGARSSERHWHEKEDELLLVLSGEATVIEDDGAHVLGAGDAAVWAAGVANAHSVENRSSKPCIYLIVGTRVTHDVCRYPGSGRVLHTEGEQWRIETYDGTVLKSGRCKSPPGRD